MGNIKDFDTATQNKYLANVGLSHPKCRQCWARYFCGGGCIHESIETSGVMYEPNDKWCQQLRRTVELGIVLYHQMDEAERKALKL